MEEQKVAQAKREKWYYHWRFALLPRFEIRKADKYNWGSFHFHWLFFRAWSLAGWQLGCEVSFSECIQISFTIPYLKCGIFIYPFPVNYLYWVQRHFWLKEKQ